MVREDVIKKHFNKMGAKVELIKRKRGRWSSAPSTPFSIDIEEKGKEEVFVIMADDFENLEFEIAEIQPKDRHLLLISKAPSTEKNKRKEVSKFLCGHDERHWFVASIPESAPGVTSVKKAMEALKPDPASTSQARHGVKGKHKNKRHNKGFLRQGEWFFVPDSDFNPDGLTIHKNEPIVRGRRGSKPHMCEELIRVGGAQVFVNGSHPNGITFKEYAKEIAKSPHLESTFRRMIRDATVYVRGKITHPDHTTVELRGWCRVYANTEDKSRAMGSVAFLD